MRFIKKILRKLKVLPPARPRWTGQDIAPETEVAFELDGKTYYKFKNELNMPASRFFATSIIYREWDLRCSEEYISGLLAIIREKLETMTTANSTAVAHKLLTLLDQTEERKKMIVEPLIVYKLASVLYMDETEDPYSYDEKHAAEKIARWKKHNMDGFFLKLPFVQSAIADRLSAKGFQEYLAAASMQSLLDLENIMVPLSKVNLKSDSLQSLMLQAEHLTELVTSADFPSLSITSFLNKK